MLMHDHFTAPLALAVGIGAGIVEKAVATHDAAILEDDDTGRVAALDAGHLDPERVKSVRYSLPGVRRLQGRRVLPRRSRWGLQAEFRDKQSRHGYMRAGAPDTISNV